MAILYSKNIAEAFHKRVEANPARTAWMRRELDSWASMSWREVEEDVFLIAMVLKSLGVRPGDKVALVASNKPRWAACDFAILSLGAVCVPVYPSLTSDDVFHILMDANVRLAIVEDSVQWFKIKGAKEKLSELSGVLMLSNSPDQDAPAINDLIRVQKESIESLTDALAEWRLIAQQIERKDMASIVYTSGTTGLQKGAVLTHGNFLTACEGVLSVVDVGEDDTSLFFLPPAHVLGRIEQFLNLLGGWKVAYCENLNHFTDYLVEIEPSFFVTVPRVFEKIYAAIEQRFKTGMPFGRQVFARALKVAEDYSKCLEQGRPPSLVLKKEYALFEQLLYSKVRSKFGKNMRFCVVGGAAMSESICRFFHACGVLILEGYGLTETAGPVSMNTPSHFKFGTVGRLFFDNRIRIGEDSEILLKGPSVFNGYHSSGEAVDELFAGDGYFVTGDVGGLDHDGYLQIVDRKKDIIVTSGGKNIAPQKIEGFLAQESLVSQAIVVGGEDKVLGALVSVDLKEARKIFRADGSGYARFDDWLGSSAFNKVLWERVRRVNRELSSFEQVKKIRRLPRDLSVEAGELTPSLKIKRSFCVKKFSNLIEEMYAGDK